MVGVIREDGKGELRGSGVYRPIAAANADEARALLMGYAMEVAAAEGRAVGLRVVDVDAVYPLVVGPNGEIAEAGLPQEKQPGEDELRPPRHEGYDPSLDAALRLPKPDMLSRTPDPEHLATRELPTHRMDEVAGASATAGESDGAALDADDDSEILDDFHDEGLDDSFEEDDVEEDDLADDVEDAGEDTAALEDVPSGPMLAADTVQDSAPSGDNSEWAPSFPRNRGQEADATLPAEPMPAPRRSPLGDSFQIPDEVPTPTRARTSPAAPEPINSTALPPAKQKALVKRISQAPTLSDFLAEQEREARLPAQQGWRAGLRHGTAGLIKLGPGKRERQEREELAAIRRAFDGSKTIVVVNPKGGAHKTTASLMIAAMFGMHRGGYTLAWDNNETRGTLGWRSQRGQNDNTAVDLLRQLPKLEVMGGATIGDIDQFVRNQGAWKFDVLASDDDAASAAIIDDEAFSRLHRTLSRFYRLLVVDTGNNMRASNWEAALDVADQLVIVSTHREDTAASAAWLADGLRERGHEDKLRNAVTILSSPSAKSDRKLTKRLTEHFEQLTRAVVEVPYDHEFVGGGQLDIDRLAPATRAAWRHATAVIAEGL